MLRGAQQHRDSSSARHKVKVNVLNYGIIRAAWAKIRDGGLVFRLQHSINNRIVKVMGASLQDGTLEELAIVITSGKLEIMPISTYIPSVALCL